MSTGVRVDPNIRDKFCKITQMHMDVMAAYIAENPIEWITRGCEGAMWTDCPYPSWDWVLYEYRVKVEPPKPREVFVKFDCNGSSRYVSDKTPLPCNGWVRFREVMPEELRHDKRR